MACARYGDRRLFRTHGEISVGLDFLGRAQRINKYAEEWGAVGFRSPVMYRNLDWFQAFNFSYDMSVPNVGHLDPQSGGCCTVMPYFVGNILELPLTTVQDYPLYHILRQRSIDLWKTDTLGYSDPAAWELTLKTLQTILLPEPSTLI